MSVAVRLESTQPKPGSQLTNLRLIKIAWDGGVWPTVPIYVQNEDPCGTVRLQSHALAPLHWIRTAWQR